MAKYIRETGEAIEITPEMIQGMEILLEMITSRNIAAEMCASWRKTKTKREEACKNCSRRHTRKHRALRKISD